MQGLARKLWNEKQGLKSPPTTRWPRIRELVEAGVLHTIDEAFALRFVKLSQPNHESVALFLCFLLMAAREGHLCVKVDQHGIEPSIKELKEDISSIINGALNLPGEFLIEEGPIARQGSLYYLRRNWQQETVCLEQIRRLLAEEPTLTVDKDIIETNLSSMLEQKSLLLEQAEAIRSTVSNALFVLTGGPGTGKTFTAGHIVRQLWTSLDSAQQKEFEIVLAAPTGKAAANLQKSLRNALAGLPLAETLTAQTLHTLLGIRKSKTQNDAFLTADLVLVDESSMIDTFVMASLLKSIKSGARLILLGDKHQLPSVEVGNVFANIVDFVHDNNNYRGRCVELTQCMRAELKGIVEFASMIKSGSLNLQHPYEGVERLEVGRYLSQPKHFVDAIAPQFISQGFNAFRVLSPMRRGPWGVDSLNRMFYESLSRHSSSQAIPIMIVQNDERTGLFNGEIGLLHTRSHPLEGDFDRNDFAVFEGRKIPALLLPKFELAYCMSVHKSQGSEFPRVVLLLPEGSEVFGREVFYTAVTRARQSIAIAAHDDTLLATLARRSLRLSGLSERLMRR